MVEAGADVVAGLDGRAGQDLAGDLADVGGQRFERVAPLRRVYAAATWYMFSARQTVGTFGLCRSASKAWSGMPTSSALIWER